MKVEVKQEAGKLAEEHWRWFEDVVGHVAKDFFVHGFKHGVDHRDKEAKDEADR